MKCPKCGFEWKNPNMVKGGKKSKRVLTPEQARAMVESRERKRSEREKQGGVKVDYSKTGGTKK